MIRAALPFALLASATVAAAAVRLPADDAADGWYTWQVAATEHARPGCCGNAPGQDCGLDSSRAGFRCDGTTTPGGKLRIYARMDSGRAVRVRVLDPACAARTDTEPMDLGETDTGESLEWLIARVAPDSPVRQDALAAIAMHRGERALTFMLDQANRGADPDIRNDAIFWLGQTRIDDASADIEHLMFTDERPDVRRQAAFSLAQSTAPNRADALIRQGRTDHDADVRSKAWFWLAQTGEPGVEQVIADAVAGDPDGEVRKEAVFALSQLPEGRAVDALVEMVEDRGMDTALRRTALFGLVQTGSDRGFAAIERLLAETPP